MRKVNDSICLYGCRGALAVWARRGRVVAWWCLLYKGRICRFVERIEEEDDDLW